MNLFFVNLLIFFIEMLDAIINTKLIYRMTREIIHPVPLWQRSGIVQEWGPNLLAPKSRRGGALFALTFSFTLLSLFSYVDRRCLYVYQKHDPRKVNLPWEAEFIAAHKH